VGTGSTAVTAAGIRTVGLLGGKIGAQLGHADDDAVVRLANEMEQHVGVLLLRALGAVALGVGVGRDMEQVIAQDRVDVAADVLGEARIDLVQHVLPVEERPHLAHGLVADPGDDAADLVHDRIDGGPLVPPVGLGARQLQPDRERLPAVLVRERLAVLVLVGHVVDARADADDRPERRVRRHVVDALPVHPHLSPVAERLAVLIAGPDHADAP